MLVGSMENGESSLSMSCIPMTRERSKGGPIPIEIGPSLPHCLTTQWVDIVQEHEFRLFVQSGQACALSQYYSECYSPYLATHSAELEVS